jgi:hypothetical protein
MTEVSSLTKLHVSTLPGYGINKFPWIRRMKITEPVYGRMQPYTIVNDRKRSSYFFSEISFHSKFSVKIVHK